MQGWKMENAELENATPKFSTFSLSYSENILSSFFQEIYSSFFAHHIFCRFGAKAKTLLPVVNMFINYIMNVITKNVL